MKKDIIRILRENARLSDKAIAARLGKKEKLVSDTIKSLEKDGTIKGYQAIIDESVLPELAVKAIIQVKVRPEREGGFDKIAKRLCKFPEVSSLSLMSGGYDLGLEVDGKTLQEVATFVSSKLAPIDGIISTETHFLLKKYKVSGKTMENDETFERLKVSP
ncbi:MAG TPA: AsnC family transcriptional regulator [Lentisphaeria bacterium]|nr:MAG: hypothetical protein A2X48_06925 [Lentisphaerae bacterium GWF2_49_21]HBC87481.1 AsnC family transcriptional regulator [Lentisphaeria bacterium]